MSRNLHIFTSSSNVTFHVELIIKNVYSEKLQTLRRAVHTPIQTTRAVSSVLLLIPAVWLLSSKQGGRLCHGVQDELWQGGTSLLLKTRSSSDAVWVAGGEIAQPKGHRKQAKDAELVFWPKWKKGPLSEPWNIIKLSGVEHLPLISSFWNSQMFLYTLMSGNQ